MLLDNTSYTISASDGINLFMRNHSVKNSNKVILLIHGLGEHSGRYLNLIQDFNDNNISVFTIDIRGHGKSEGKRGHSPYYEQLMSDIQYFVKDVIYKTSNQKHFLYGHSMGGNLVINYSLQKDEKITREKLSFLRVDEPEGLSPTDLSKILHRKTLHHIKEFDLINIQDVK